MATNCKPAITVVIPIYNGALYIERTLKSLLNQSFINFEIICVNDGSTDNSLNIIESFAKNDHRIKVFSKSNGGTATNAIIFGLKYATGRYFMYSSQDDLFSVDLLDKTYLKAESCNADAVVPDMDYYRDDIDSPIALHGIHGIHGDRTRELSGTEAFVLSLDWTIHGFVLWNMEIVKKVGFYEYGLNSDEYTVRMFFFNSKKVVFCDGIFFYRQDNPQAITKKWNINQLDCIETCKRLELFAEENGYSKHDISKIHSMLLGEMIRVQIMFNKNKDKITIKEKTAYGNKIKNIYHENIGKIKSIEANGFKEIIKLKLTCLSYHSFKYFCKAIPFLQICYESWLRRNDVGSKVQ